MDEHGKSDRPIVPKKAANKGEPPTGELSAEWLEGRGLAKGNSIRHDRHWTLSRARLQNGLDRVRQAAVQDEVRRFAVHPYPRPTPGRYDPRQEPSAVVPHAGICGGGPGKPGFLLRHGAFCETFPAGESVPYAFYRKDGPPARVSA